MVIEPILETRNIQESDYYVEGKIKFWLISPVVHLKEVGGTNLSNGHLPLICDISWKCHVIQTNLSN